MEPHRLIFFFQFFNFRTPSERSGKDCCGQWFRGPPLRFLVALVALGGVACTLGGATLSMYSLAGSPTSHLTAGLLMTGKKSILYIKRTYLTKAMTKTASGETLSSI